MRKNPGFTVIELVVVILIVAILTAFTIPSVMSWIPEKRLRSAGDELFSNLLYTKMQAIKNNVSWAIVFDVNANRYQVFSNRGADNSWSGIADNTLEKTVNLNSYGDGVRFGGGNASSGIGGVIGDGVQLTNEDVAVFNSRGMSANTGYVYLTNNAGSAVAVGVPGLAGVVVQRVWRNSSWQ